MNNNPQQYWGTSPADPLLPSVVECTILAFTLANDTPTTPTIVAEYPITNNIALTIEQPFMDTLEDTTYLIAVRYTDTDGNVFRYILYAPDDFTILYPAYTGQKLGASAIVEIWANPDETLITASQDIVFNLNTLTMYNQSNSTLCYCTVLVDGAITLEQTVMSPQTTGPCNPFCDCLELAAG